MAMSAAATNGSCDIDIDAVDEALQRSEGTFHSPRMVDANDTDAVEGVVRWKAGKSLWISIMTIAGLVGGPFFFSWGALAVFIVMSAVTVCLGHSLGMHRRLIHRSYDCPLWLERFFVYCGTLVGMAGPYGMIRQHDIRDWAQRKPQCQSCATASGNCIARLCWRIRPSW